MKESTISGEGGKTIWYKNVVYCIVDQLKLGVGGVVAGLLQDVVLE